MKDKIKTYLLILPRWFTLPCALCAIALGALLAQGVTWQVGLVLVAGSIMMVGGHYYNSWADYTYGLDKGTPASVGKWYTAASTAIARGLTSAPKTLIGWAVCYAISAVLVYVVCASIGSAWPWLGWGIGVTTATVYSPGFTKGLKMLGFPEYCGLVGFGIGGCLLGYSASSGTVSFVPVLSGLAISMFFSVAWAADQFPDARSDYRKGVRNLGTIIAMTGFPMGLYFLPAMVFAYVFQLFVITLGFLSPWTFLSALIFPQFVLATVWVTKGQDDPDGLEFQKGVRLGLYGIWLAMILIVIGQAIGG